MDETPLHHDAEPEASRNETADGAAIVVLHAGGLGDLVLIETLIAGLREKHADAHVTLICREHLAPVASLYAHPPDALVTFAFDPYRWATPADAADVLAPFLAALALGPVDVFIAAELKSTWLGEVLAAALRPREAIVCDSPSSAPAEVSILLRMLRLQRNDVALRPAAKENEHELDRYARLLGVARKMPSFRADDAGAAREPRIVVFSAGSPDLKRWSNASTREAVSRIAARTGARVTLVGSSAERADLEALASGIDASAPWEIVCGSAAELPRIATLIAAATGYLAIDTGLAHLAAAYGIPGVTVYGGGTWPSYAPWGRASAGVVAPLPCFGCLWDCAFERAFCLERISVDAVVDAFERVALAGRAEPHIAELAPYSAGERAILGAAAAVHRATQADRAARLTVIVRMQDVWRRYVHHVTQRQAEATAVVVDVTHRLATASKRLAERAIHR